MLKIKNSLLLSVCLISVLTFFSCGGKKPKPVYIDIVDVESPGNIVKVPYTEMYGVKTISVKINGVPMNMIYDTGCSGVHLSLLELQTLCKNGQFSENDIIGSSYSSIADGSIVENGLINLREIEIGGENGITLYNVQASVALNQEAPVLLGNGVFDSMASVELDNYNKTINFKKR